jgi:antitoxin component YwqK of YwqJK toxin-antitoxin module
VLALALLLACGADTGQLKLDCPDKTDQQELTPVQGGRAVWCERKNHARYGPMVEFRQDGTKWKEGWYITVRKEGKFTWYFPDGVAPEEISNWKLNKLEGERTQFDPAGKVLRHETWSAGKLVSADVVDPDAPEWPDGVVTPPPTPVPVPVPTPVPVP